MQSVKNSCARVEKWHFVRAVIVLLAKTQINRAQHDLQILRDLGLGMLVQCGFELSYDRFGFFALYIFVGKSGLAYLVIKFSKTFVRAGFRMMFHPHVEQHMRIAIADGDPALIGVRFLIRLLCTCT